MIEVRRCGTTTPTAWRAATDVHEVTVTSAALAVRVLTLGAAIEACSAPDASGASGPVHLTLPSTAEYEDRARNPHLGATIGRYANRIAGARFPLDGRTVELVANSGANQLHGGPIGFDRHVWDLVGADASGDGGVVTMRLVSPDGDQGFPGTVDATATYELDGPVLRITYRCTTDAPTVVNLTNHGYWNLDGGGTVEDQLLCLASQRVLPVDDEGIPTGPPVDVEGTPFDLRMPTRLGDAMSALPTGGLDHCFVVDGDAGTLRPTAVLASPATGRWMSLRTDRPGVQVYTGNNLADPFLPHGSVSLEAQLLPDTPNRPELGSAVLRPGDVDQTVTELRFGTGEPPT